jgi:glutaredoxin
MYWVYGGKNSPNTKITVNVIEQFRMPYKYISADDDKAAQELIGEHGHTEPPVVFWNNKYVGGYLEVREDVLRRVHVGLQSRS